MAGLEVSSRTVRTYLDVLSDLYIVRQLQPWAGNTKKRLVRSPKTYVRDSGLLHRLANVPDLETLPGSPLCGRSWEGFAIEQAGGTRATRHRARDQALLLTRAHVTRVVREDFAVVEASFLRVVYPQERPPHARSDDSCSGP